MAGAGVHAAAQRPALDHEGRRADHAQAPERFVRVLAAAGDVELLLGAITRWARGDDLLQPLGDVLRGDEALLAHAGGGEAPEHGAVVDVEDEAPGLAYRAEHTAAMSGAKVRARDEEGLRRADERGIEIRRRDSHVGALVA